MSVLLQWIGHIILRAEPTPRIGERSQLSMRETIRNAAQADQAFKQLERRARALGIEVDVSRSLAPRDPPGGG